MVLVLFIDIHASGLPSDGAPLGLFYHILFFRGFLMANNGRTLVLCKNVFIPSLYGLLGQTFKVETTHINFQLNQND